MHTFEFQRSAALPDKRALLGLGLMVAVVAIVASTVVSAVQAFYVDGSSMAPTLHNGQLVIVNKVAYWRLDESPLANVLSDGRTGTPLYLFGGPHRGDIIVFQAPTTLEGGDFVKRLIGLPGDTVLVQAGRVIVNGQPLDEAYIKFPDDYTYPTDGRPLRVPEGAYFVLGDNRGASVDSHLGWFVPADNLVGPGLALPLAIG